jgi:F-type H+-transporting ATPase subunit delta
VKSAAGSRVLAERYARALLAVVLDKKVDMEKVSSELASVVALFDREPKLSAVLSSPAIDPEKRIAIIEEVLRRVKPAAATLNLLRLLVTNERVPLLGVISETFRRLVLEQKQIQPAEVVSAHALSSDQQNRLAKSLGRALGKTMELSYSTDPGLVGGVLVRIGNRVYDASVITQLRRFKERALTSS